MGIHLVPTGYHKQTKVTLKFYTVKPMDENFTEI
jgi:hypothetical protein